jgi:hypothetical protein
VHRLPFSALYLQQFHHLLHNPLELVEYALGSLLGRQVRGDPALVAVALAQLSEPQVLEPSVRTMKRRSSNSPCVEANGLHLRLYATGVSAGCVPDRIRLPR